MPTILLIDDSGFMRMANERALSRAGYKVLGTDNGQTGLELAESALLVKAVGKAVGRS